jgi:hypothetical protein
VSFRSVLVVDQDEFSFAEQPKIGMRAGARTFVRFLLNLGACGTDKCSAWVQKCSASMKRAAMPTKQTVEAVASRIQSISQNLCVVLRRSHMSLMTAQDQAETAVDDVSASETRSAPAKRVVAISYLLTAATAMIVWLYVLALGVWDGANWLLK